MSSNDLILAAKNGDLNQVVQCIKLGISVHTRDKDNATALYWSSCRGYSQICTELIKLGCDVNARVTWGSTALHASCDRGHLSIVALLIHNGAELNIQNRSGNTALHLSAYRGHIEIVRLLIKVGINIFIRNEKGKCAAEEASSGNHVNTAQYIYRKMKDYQDKLIQNVSKAHSCPEIQSRGIPDSLIVTKPFKSCDFDLYNTPNEKSEIQRFHSETGDIRKIINNGSDIPTKPGTDVKGCATDDREHLVTLIEKLQIQLVKANEETIKKDKQIKELRIQNENFNSEINKYKKVCQRLYQEKSELAGKQTKYEQPRDDLLQFIRDCELREGKALLSNDTLSILRIGVCRKWVDLPPLRTLDVPNKEWFPGTDFVVSGDRPLNVGDSGRKDSPRSLVFQIKHVPSTKSCVLKMMINLINMQVHDHGEGFSLDRFLSGNFSQEYDIPVNLNHRNIVTILHHYTGSTERFRRFLNLLVTNTVDVSIEMARKTTFLVMEYYPQTLQSFITRILTPVSESRDVFLFCLLYQILSAVCYLRKSGIVHRDITAQNIFLDNYFRPVLGDFGMAIQTKYKDKKPIQCEHCSQITAGNPHSWAPELMRYNRNSGLIIGQGFNLESIYEKVDLYAVGRMFYSILRSPDDSADFPQSTASRPHYNNDDIPVLPAEFRRELHFLLRNLVLNNPKDRLTDTKAKICVGIFLFTPKRGSITQPDDVRHFCQARLIKLLADDKPVMEQPTQNYEDTLKALLPELEADFLSTTSVQDFWEIYSYLISNNII